MVEKQLVLVVGMHRSGTSATAQVLAGLGVAFGDNLLPPQDDNPLGFQEDLSFVALNEELVGPAYGWYSIHNRCHENHTADWDKRAKEWWEVFKSAQEPTHIGLKDPRICRSLPFWKDIFEEDIKVVHVVRAPLAVAESLRKRNDFDVQFSLALWFVYNFEAWSYITRYKYEALTIDYDKLVDSEDEIRSKIKSFLSLDEQLEVNAGIEKTLRHNINLDSENFEIFSLCEALYTRLLDGSVDIGTELEPFYNHLVSRYRVFDRETVESFDKRRAINDLSHSLEAAAKKNSEITAVLSKEKDSLEKANLLLQEKDAALSKEKDSLEKANLLLEERDAELLHKNNKLNLQKKRLAEKSITLIENNRELGAQQQQLDTLTRELNHLRQHSHHLQVMLDSLINSESWKVTTPARWFGRCVKELRITKLIKQAIEEGGGVKGTVQKTLTLYRNEGLDGLKRGFYKVRSGAIHQPLESAVPGLEGVDRNDYLTWVQHFDTMNDAWRQQMRSAVASWQHCPSFSVIMPVFNPEPEMLKAAIASVTGQLYPYWELCIADDASTDPAIREILEDYALRDQRIKVVFREENGHISANSNSALALAEQEWVVLFDHDDLLTEHALFYMANAIRENPQARLLYSDEDKINEKGQRHGPYFKPDWNRDLFYSHNMISHLGVYQRKIVERIGGFREGFEGSQDHDLALRFIECIDENQIHHVPRVLYHWRMHSGSTAASGEAKPYTVQAALNAINEHFGRTGVKGHVEATPFGYRARYELPENPPLVSLIIPTRNGLRFVRMCIESITKHTDYPNYEILLVDNNSDDPDALAYFAELNERDNIKVIRDEQPFNYSAINNDAVAQANGEVIALVNNDIEAIDGGWLSEMVSLALQPGVGAVGAKLYYPNDTLQHAGVILGIQGVANHAHKHFPKESAGYFGRAKIISSFSAVTAACLVIRKSIFEEVGGLDAKNLKIAFNDIDFCLRVREAGYRNVWTPYAALYHHESVSRGYEDTPEKQARFASEVNYMQLRWKDSLFCDPSYNPNLTLADTDFSLSWAPRL